LDGVRVTDKERAKLAKSRFVRAITSATTSRALADAAERDADFVSQAGNTRQSFSEVATVWAPGDDHRRAAQGAPLLPTTATSAATSAAGKGKRLKRVRPAARRAVVEELPEESEEAAVTKMKALSGGIRAAGLAELAASKGIFGLGFGVGNGLFGDQLAQKIAGMDPEELPSTMFYTTVYVPRERPRLSTDGEAGGDGEGGGCGGGDDGGGGDGAAAGGAAPLSGDGSAAARADAIVSLAEDILRMPTAVLRPVAKCRRCGCLLPSDVDAMELHESECLGPSETVEGMARRCGVSTEAKEDKLDKAAMVSPRKDGGWLSAADADVAVKVATVASEATLAPLKEAPQGVEGQRERAAVAAAAVAAAAADEHEAQAAWVGRLENLARELGAGNVGPRVLVRDLRLGKRLLRKAFVGTEAVEWLLHHHCPDACRDEEQAVLLGRTMLDRGLIKPLFHEV